MHAGVMVERCLPAQQTQQQTLANSYKEPISSRSSKRHLTPAPSITFSNRNTLADCISPHSRQHGSNICLGRQPNGRPVARLQPSAAQTTTGM